MNSRIMLLVFAGTVVAASGVGLAGDTCALYDYYDSPSCGNCAAGGFASISCQVTPEGDYACYRCVPSCWACQGSAYTSFKNDGVCSGLCGETSDSASACYDAACAPATTTTTVPSCVRSQVCRGNDLMERDVDCSEEYITTCAYGCSGGLCNPAPATTTSTTTTPPGETCAPGYVCSGSDRYYRYADCSTTFQSACSFGCDPASGACNAAPASTTTMTSSTTTTTIPASLCADLAYSLGSWQRNWYIRSSGACLGTVYPAELSFDDNWGSGTVAFSKTNDVKFYATRKISAQGGGLFSFRVGSDDGVQVTIGSQTVVDDLNDHSYQERRSDVELREGEHDVFIHYYENGGDARVKFEMLPKPLETVDLFLSKTGFDYGEDMYLYGLARGDQSMGTFYGGSYSVRFLVDCPGPGVSGCADTGLRCDFADTEAPPLCFKRYTTDLPVGAHQVRAHVYQGVAPLAGVWDEETITIRDTPVPSTTTTTTTTLPPPGSCTRNDQCADLGYGLNNVKWVCNSSPYGLPARPEDGPVDPNTCYLPSTCRGNEKYPSGADIKSSLCRPTYCCSGELASTVGGGSCVRPGDIRGAGNYLCIG